MIGSRIKCTERVFWSGRMANSMKEISLMIREKDKANLYGLMGDNILENGDKVSSMVKVLIYQKRDKRK